MTRRGRRRTLAVDQRASLVVAAESVADVVQAVRYARAHGMRIARKARVMAPRRSNRWRAAQLAAGFRPNRGGLVLGRSVPATAQLGRADLQRRSVPAHAARRRLRAGREPALLAEDIAESVASLR
jgi:hypothetical protein